MILNREVYFPIFQQHRAELVGAWYTFKNTHKGRASHDTRLSVWLAHAVVLTGRMIGDSRWSIAYLSAALANTHWRENARALRAEAQTDRPLSLPHEYATTYYRVFGFPPYAVHAVAAVKEECVNLYASVLNNESRCVSCEPCTWSVFDNSRQDFTGMPCVAGAEWEFFATATPSSNVFSRYAEAQDEAAHALRKYSST